jgi:enoyl-CoA hydratase
MTLVDADQRWGGRDTDPAGTIRYTVDGNIAHITLSRPQVSNAQNGRLLYALDDALYMAAADDDVRVVILSGEGKHFSAGHDLGSPERDSDRHFDRTATLWGSHVGLSPIEARFARESELYLGLCKRWRELPKPTIAMVRGACIAGGLMLAWVCDLIVASDNAYFSDPVARMGIPGVEYFAHPWEVGHRAAKEMIFLGEKMSSERAYQLGMVNKVVPDADLLDETNSIARRIAAQPPFGMTLAKKAVNQTQDLMGFNQGLDSVFGLHHLAHARNAESSDDSLGGVDLKAMRQANNAGQ